MTTFIPEWGPVSGAALSLRRLFNELGDDATVRTPLHPRLGQPDYFLAWAGRGWLAIVLCRAKYAEVRAEQLFASEARAGFLHMLAELDTTLPTLLVMWSCDTEEAAALARDATSVCITLCTREQLAGGGASYLAALVRPVAAEGAALRRRYFPERRGQPHRS